MFYHSCDSKVYTLDPLEKDHFCHTCIYISMLVFDVADNMLQVSEVVRLLLHHVGSSSCHKVHSDVLQTTALGRLLLNPTPPPLPHLTRLCAVLEKAVEERDVPVVQCMLVVLQVWKST